MTDEPEQDLNSIVRQLNALAKKDPRGGEDDDAPVPAAPGASGAGPSAGPTAGPAAARTSPERRDWMLPAGDEEARERLAALLIAARDAGASDLFLVAGAPPAVRVDGGLRPLPGPGLDTGDVGRLCSALVPDARRNEVARDGAADLSWGTPKVGRVRCNVHRESGRWAAAIRLLPATVPTLNELNLPADLASFAELRHGLVLVTGPAGSGKSTTLAALLALITAKRRAHVVTIEDPIEYRHAPGQSLVEQIEVGRDTPSYAAALRAALRQDPDVLLVGEMRDPETIALAITAAETGHLVFSTLHTGDAAQSITRIIDSYPPGQAPFIRAQLAAALAAVVSQQLLPRTGGGGRVPAVEVLVVNDAVRNLIQKGQGEQIATQVTLGREKGMRSFDQSLAELVKAGLCDRDEARQRARRLREFELHLSS
jgi:twitching motility protein PilT